MESRIRRVFLSAWLAIGCAATDSFGADGPGAPVIQPQIERKPTELAQIDTENWELGAFAGLMSVEDFGVNPVYGARLAYFVTRGFFFEAAYGMTDTDPTSYERLSGAAQLLTDDERKLTYYNLSIGYNLLPGEAFLANRWAHNHDLYVIGGIGTTRFAGDDYLTVNLGAGYRFIATDWLALHLDVRDHIFDSDLLGFDKTMHNLELTGGMTFFF